MVLWTEAKEEVARETTKKEEIVYALRQVEERQEGQQSLSAGGLLSQAFYKWKRCYGRQPFE
jgi:hypothetical protein